MATYYNEWDKNAAAWLRELIRQGHLPGGDVDERSIADVQSSDLAGYTQCHFFAGIGGWPYALRLAGWPDDERVWTGSCPCQRLSTATRGRHTAEDMWPHFRRLIAERCPKTVFGEQVAHAGWFDKVCDDLENLEYTIGAAVLPACSVGKDHARLRLYFVGHAYSNCQSRMPFHAETSRLPGCKSKSGDRASSHGISARMGRLRGYGNAIVPPLAAEFVKAYMDVR